MSLISNNWPLVYCILPKVSDTSKQCGKYTVKFLNFRTPENFAVNYVKLKQRGQTIEYFVQKMQME